MTRIKGRITKIWNSGRPNSGWGFITGEDGVSYHFNFSSVLNKHSTLKTDYIVEFEPSKNTFEEHAGKPEAVNILKIGHGKHHPFARDAQRLGDAILKYVPDDAEEKKWLLVDIDAIYNYFCAVEDSERYANVRDTFRRKSNETEET